MSELRDVIAKPIEEVQRKWFREGLTIAGGNLSNACTEAVIAAIGDSGRVVVDRARFERLLAVAAAADRFDRARRAAMLEIDPLKRARLSAESFGVEIEMGEARDALEPGDLEPL